MEANGLTNIAQDQYIKLLVAQLQNQNPLDPVSNTELLGQVTQFSTLQGINQLNASFSELLTLQQLTQGSSLLGRQVTYQVPNSDTLASGIVSALAVDNGSIVLRVGQANVSLAQVRAVQ
jgi:flagellar basal-body rod modification protein FlgD